MEQIFHTMTEDGVREIGIYADGENLKVCIDDQEVFAEEDIELPLTQEDIEYYIGIADLYYETNIEMD